MACLCTSLRLIPRRSHQRSSSKLYLFLLPPRCLPKEKEGTWTALREQDQTFLLQHPNFTLVAESVTKGNGLKLPLGRLRLDIIFIRTMSHQNGYSESCEILLHGTSQGLARENHSWPGPVLVTVLLQVGCWPRWPPKRSPSTSISVTVNVSAATERMVLVKGVWKQK